MRSNAHWPKVICLLSLIWTGCAPSRTVVKPGVDLSKIRRISVIPFEGPGGREVTDEFVRQLVGTGIEVTDAKHAGDGVLKGTVLEFKPATTQMVFLGNTTLVTAGGQTAVVNNPILSSESSHASPEGTAMGLQNAQVASVSASVGVSAALLETSSGSPLWSGAFTYEGLDVQGALRVVVGALTQSLSGRVPQMRKGFP